MKKFSGRGFFTEINSYDYPSPVIAAPISFQQRRCILGRNWNTKKLRGTIHLFIYNTFKRLCQGLFGGRSLSSTVIFSEAWVSNPIREASLQSSIFGGMTRLRSDNCYVSTRFQRVPDPLRLSIPYTNVQSSTKDESIF